MKSILIILLLSFSSLIAQNSYSTKSEWLLDTKSDTQKFKKIQKQFRGFDLAMVEVGYRFNSFYFALKDKNYDLANYQWDKIKKSIENGIQRRPKRTQNTKAIFLDTYYDQMKEVLATKDEKKIWTKYENTKRVCNACHSAEKVPFIKVIDPQYRWQPIQ